MTETAVFSKNTEIAMPEALQHLIDQLSRRTQASPEEIAMMINTAEISQEDLMPWADFDHPVADSYGRKLVWHGGHFEVMVMSWRPGDFSGLHDHGHAEWGAVQIFGPAEHAAFAVSEGVLHTTARWTVEPGDILRVDHSLIHQMGNPTTDQYFLSLHVYGEPEAHPGITDDARVFDLRKQLIQRVSGGVFFALEDADINSTEPGPESDFPTRLRYSVELIRRLRQMSVNGVLASGQILEDLVSETFSAEEYQALLRHVKSITDYRGRITDPAQWNILKIELRAAAQLLDELHQADDAVDLFHAYADLYDAVVGRPCLDAFVSGYWEYMIRTRQIDLGSQRILSLGSGTGLTERYLIEGLGASYDNLMGIDRSAAMVSMAQQRIRSEAGNILALRPEGKPWDIVYSGLNVFQYLQPDDLPKAIAISASMLREGGYFIGDFITPDHLRAYPNLIVAADGRTLSLRTPRIVDEDGRSYQESEILNVQALGETFEIAYPGIHRRYLPALALVRQLFIEAFGDNVELYDAESLEPVADGAVTCPSTRYVVIARKGKAD